MTKLCNSQNYFRCAKKADRKKTKIIIYMLCELIVIFFMINIHADKFHTVSVVIAIIVMTVT